MKDWTTNTRSSEIGKTDHQSCLKRKAVDPVSERQSKIINVGKLNLSFFLIYESGNGELSKRQQTHRKTDDYLTKQGRLKVAPDTTLYISLSPGESSICSMDWTPITRTNNGPGAFHSHYNEQFFSPFNVCIIDNLIKMQATKYIKIRSTDSEPVRSRHESRSESFAIERYQKLTAGKITRKDYVHALSYFLNFEFTRHYGSFFM